MLRNSLSEVEAPAPERRVKEQFLHMLGTFHALEHKHTWATSQVVDISYVFGNAAAVRWGEGCAVSDVLLTRSPCRKVKRFKIQSVPRWRTVKTEVVVGLVSGLKLHVRRPWAFSAPVLALAQWWSKRRLPKAAFLHLRWKWASALPAHLSNFCNSQGKAMSAIFGGFIPTYKGLTHLHSTLTLWPRKWVEIRYKCIGLPGQWLGNSQKKVCTYSRHSHHSSDLPQVFSEKQPCWRSPRKSLCCQSSSRTWNCSRQPWWPMCFSGWAAMSRRGP